MEVLVYLLGMAWLTTLFVNQVDALITHNYKVYMQTE